LEKNLAHHVTAAEVAVSGDAALAEKIEMAAHLADAPTGAD
jgi:hypothetical protein